MIKAKDCVCPLPPWVVMYLGLGVCFLQFGCAGMGGLRSIGMDPASFLGFRNRSGPGSPSPENDLYAQAMQAPRVGSVDSTKQADKPATKPGSETRPADPTAPPADAAEATRAATRSPSSIPDERDVTIRVSLGRPEPLPALRARCLSLRHLHPQPVLPPGGQGGPTAISLTYPTSSHPPLPMKPIRNRHRRSRSGPARRT